MTDFNDALAVVSEEDTYKKRYADLRRFQQSERERFERELAEAKGEAVLPASADEVKEWVTKFPEVAKIVAAIAAEQTQKIAGTKIEQIQQKDSQRELAEAMGKVVAAHPDFMELRNDEAFREWAKNTSWAYAALSGVNPKPVIEALDYYKSMVLKSDKQIDRRAAATAVARSGQQTPGDERLKWTESMVSKLKPSEFLKHEEEIMKASLNPEFYDITGAAR